MRPAPILISFFVSILTTSPQPAAATESVALAWNPSPTPNIAGYNIHYGIQSGHYTTLFRCGMNVRAVIPNLADGTTYFFVVTAVTSSGNESAPSNEAVYTTGSSGRPWTAIAHVSHTRPPSFTAKGSGHNHSGATRISHLLAVVRGHPAQAPVVAAGNNTSAASDLPTSQPGIGGDAVRSASAKPDVRQSSAMMPDIPASSSSSQHSRATTLTNLIAAKLELALDQNDSKTPAAGGFTFTLQRTSAMSGHIEYSTNLRKWIYWTNFDGAETTLTFTDADAAHSPQRFYRAVIP